MTRESHVKQPQGNKERRSSAARQAQWRFQADLLDQLGDAVIAVDQDERITYLNRAAVAQYGVDLTGAIGQPLHYVHRYEWLQPEDDLLAEAALAQQGYWRGENRHIRQDGSALQVESVVTLLHDETGNKTGMVAVIRDMTDRKQAEHTLRVNELRYRRLADTMPQLIWTADRNGDVNYYNIHIHDFDPSVWQGITGFDWTSMIHPDDLAPTLTTWQEAVRQRQTYTCEHRLHMADGSWRWHLSRAVLVQDPDQGLKWYGTATDVHERKVTEEQIKFHASLLDYAYDAVIATDADLNVTAWNRGAEEMYGWSAAEVLGRKPHEVLRSTMTPTARAEAVRQMAESGRFCVESTTYHRDGTPIVVEGHSVAMRDDNDRITGYMSISRDIRERKVAEEALRTSEERYRTLFEAMDEGFCVFELLYTETGEPIDYRFLEANPAFARFTGLENAVGKTAYELVPNLEAKWVAIYAEVAHTGAARHFIEGSAAMGRWFEIYAFRFGGPESRRVALLFTNVTERKLMEDALHDSEAELRYTVELNPQAPWTADPAGNIISFNQRWLDLTGLTEETALGGGWVQASHPDDRPAIVAAWSYAIQYGEPYDIEHRIRLADGSYCWMRSRAFPRRDVNGAIVRWYGATEDIHERKLAEEALRASEAQLAAELADAKQLQQISSQMVQEENIQALYEQILAAALAMMGAEMGSMQMLNPENDLLLLAWQGFDPAAAAFWARVRVDSASTCGMALHTRVRVLVADVECADFMAGTEDLAFYRLSGIRAVQSTPLVSRSGRIVGMISTHWRSPHQPADRDWRRLDVLARQAADLIERKLAEEALRASEERLRLATEAGSVGIFDHDLIANQTEVSPIYRQITGLAPDAVVTRESWLALVHPEDRPLVTAIWQEAQSASTAYYYECHLLRPDGALAWIEVNAWVMRDETGRGVRITGAVRDITERKQTALHQQFLLDLNSTLRTLSDATAIQQTVVERLGQYLGADRCRFNAVDLSADKSTLLAVWSRPGLPPPTDINPLSTLAPAAYISSAQAGRTLVIQDAHQDEQNEIIKALMLAHGFVATIRVPCLREGAWVASLHVLQTTPRPWRADEVQLVESVVHHFWPLTEKARTEQELRHVNERFVLAEAAVPGWIYDYDWRTGEVMRSDGFQRILGYTAEESQPTAAWWQSLIHPDDWQWLQREIGALSPPGDRRLLEYRVRDRNGQYHHMWDRARVIRNEQGEIVRLVGSSVDITERKQMEEALHASEARFRAVQQASPDGYMIFESVRNEQGVIIDFRWLYVNPASEQMIGRTQAELLGKQLLVEMPGNREEGLFDAYVQVVETGVVYQREFCYQHDGIDRWFRNTAAKAGDGFAVAFSDITARKQAEADQQLLADLAEQIRLADEPEELISAAVRLVGDHLRVGRCLWIEIYAAEQRGFIHAQHCRDLPPVPETYANADYSPITRAELTAGRLLVNHDAQQDPRTAAFYATTYAPYQERAYIGVPFLQEGHWRGILSVTVPEARQWQVSEIHLLETVAERVWLAVEKLRLHAILRANEARLRQALVAANAGSWFYDLVEDAAYWSPEMFDLYGLSPALGAPRLTAFAALIHPDERAQVMADLAAAQRRGGHFAVEFRVVRADGQERWMNSSGVVDLDAAGQPVAASGIDQDITVRKQAEIALQQSNAILQGVLECSNDAIFVRDLTGRYLLVNEAGAAQVRLPKNAILGRRYQEIFTAAEVTAIQEDDRAVLAQGRAVTVEHVVAQQDALRYWHTLKMPLRDANGAIIGLISSARDLTTGKVAEEALRLSEARYRTIFENAGVSLWEEDFSLVKQAVDAMVADWRAAGITDLGTAMHDHCAAHPAFVRAMLERVRILDVNEETVRLYGRPKTELLRPFAQHFTDETLTHFVNQLVLIARNGQRYTFDGPIETPQGETHHVAFTLVFPAEAESDFTRVLLSGLDITTLKEAEMALRSSEARFRHLAEAMPQIVWTCQADGSMTYINQQWQQYSGLPTATTLAEGMWPAIHPADLPTNRELWRRALENGVAYEGEVRLRRQDGRYRWFLERAIPVRDEAGVITQWFGVSVDIDDRKVAEQRQAELVALLEAMLENAPVGFAFLDREQRFVRINQMLADQHGRAIADHIGRTFAEIAPRTANSVGPILDQVFTTGEGIYNREISGPKVANPQEIVHALASWFPVAVNGVTHYVGSMIVDITERKRQERHQQFLSELGMDLRLLSDTETILTQLANRLGQYLQVAGCRVNEINLQREQFVLQKDWVAADAPWSAATTGTYPLTELAPPALLAALQAGQTVVVANTLHDPRTALVAENYDNDQVHSLIGVPIFRQGEWRATLSVKGHGERQWRPDEVALLETVAGQLSALLEKVRAEEALRASEARFRQTFAQAPVGVGQATLDGRIESVNPAFCRILGYTEEELIGRNMRELSLLEDREAEMAIGAQARAANLPAATVEKRYRRKDGRVIWANRTGSVVNDANGRPLFGVAIIEEISERKEAEERLRQSEERLRLALAGGGMGIWESQIAANRSLWSPEMYALFGLPVGVEITNELFNRLIHPADLPGLQAAIQQLIRSGSDHVGEFRIVRPDGAVRWLADRVTVIRDEAGEPVRLLGINFDITERKEREAMIQQQLAEIEAIYATAPVGLAVLDAELRYVRVNQHLAELNGAAAAEHIGRTGHAIVPQVMVTVEPLLRAVITTGQPILNREIIDAHPAEPGRERVWLESFYPLHNEAGMVIGINTMVQEITERKAQEALIRQQLAEIEAIYATAPIGLCLIDRDLRYVRINETLATSNGGASAGYRGRTLAETMPVEGYRLVEPLYRHVIETGIPLLHQEVHESYVDPAQARDWLANYYPLKNGDGVVTGVNAVILEITERKRQERQLKELNATLEERVRERTRALEQANRALSITNRELEQFTYAAAHDLRTPLRGIANLVQWISEDAAPVLPPASQRHLGQLGGRVKRLEKMLEDMLAYSRIGRVRYAPEAVDVPQLVRSLLELLVPPVGFVINLVPPLPTFTALRVPLELVFRNLLSNAVRHHHEPAHGQVEITVRDLGEWYEFRVSDNGPGIEPQYHERIFGMFQTLKPRDQVEGSGIGLALVKKTIENIGGRIWMESVIGQGTSFYFTWPKEQRAEE